MESVPAYGERGVGLNRHLKAHLPHRQDISCRITNVFLNYVKNTRPEFVEPLVRGLPYTYQHLVDTDNWIAWDAERVIEERLVDLYDDPQILFQIGRSIVTHKSLGVIHILFNLFTTPEGVFRYTPKVASLFTKGIVTVNILNSSSQSVIIELKIKGPQTRGSCLFNLGMFSAVPELFGLKSAEVIEHQCMVAMSISGKLKNTYGIDEIKTGAESCIFELRWKGKKDQSFMFGGTRKQKALDEARIELEENYVKLQSAYDLLACSEERYRDLFNNAGDIIILLDSDGTIAAVNKKGTSIFGVPANKLIGRPIGTLIDESYRSELQDHLSASMTGTQIVIELVGLTKDGTRLLSVTSSPIMQDGNTIGLMVIARDISAERELAARLLEAERFAAKGLVAAEIAHEINNALANIETALYISNNISINDKYRSTLMSETRAEIQGMSNIVRGILDVYKADDTSAQMVSLNNEIKKVMDLTARRFKGDNIRMISRLCLSDPVIFCNPGHFKQILLNLLTNSRDALENGSTRSIIVSTEEIGEDVRLKVMDTGCGIPPDVLPEVTDRVFSTKSKGTGLGLSICKRLAEANKGVMEIESALGKGTTVYITFRKGQND